MRVKRYSALLATVCLLLLQGRSILASCHLDLANRATLSASSSNCGAWYRQAEAWYHQAIYWEPLNARARAGLGRLYFCRGDYDLAVQQLAQSDESDSVSRLYLGLAQSALGHDGEALSTWCTIRASPYFVASAVRAESSGNLSHAEADCRRAIEIDSRGATWANCAKTPHALLGDLYRRERRWSEAVASYTAAVRSRPSTDAESHYWLAWVLAFGLSKYDQAIETYKRGIALYPSHMWQYLGLGEVYLARGDHAAAATLFSTARQRFAGDPWPQFYLGALCYHRADYTSAVRYYEAALSAGADSPRVHLELGMAYLKSGRPLEALPQLLQATRESPQDPNAWSTLGDTYDTLGHLDKAISAHQRAKQVRLGHGG